jgi:molybdopterin synthase catalytic subunit
MALVTGIAIAHRGTGEIGETSGVVVSAPHRREALAACAHGIERLKAGLPVWKKEVFADGSEGARTRPRRNPTRGGEALRSRRAAGPG